MYNIKDTQPIFGQRVVVEQRGGGLTFATYYKKTETADGVSHWFYENDSMDLFQVERWEIYVRSANTGIESIVTALCDLSEKVGHPCFARIYKSGNGAVCYLKARDFVRTLFKFSENDFQGAYQAWLKNQKNKLQKGN